MDTQDVEQTVGAATRHASLLTERCHQGKRTLVPRSGKEDRMPTTRTDPDDVSWVPATEMFGDGAFYDGKPVLEVKALSDRRAEGGGVALLLRASPPPGKLIKIIAVARSDEHVFNLSGGGRANKSGKIVDAPGGYTLNPEGQPHSAMIAQENVSLVVYRGAPDEVSAVEVIDIAPELEGAA